MSIGNVSRGRSLGIAAAVAVVVAVAAPAAAQEGRSQVTLQATGVFTQDLNAPGISREATTSGGILFGYAYRLRSWVGLEGSYGYTRNTQRYVTDAGVASIQSNVHQLLASFAVRVPTGGSPFGPYVLAGGGAITFDPTSDVTLSGTGHQTRVAFIYGGGVDIDLARGLGVRLEYRGLVYQTPDFGVGGLYLDNQSHLAQPSLGVFFRF